MKKKLLIGLLTLFVVCLVAGCNVFNDPITSLSWEQVPQSEYSLVTVPEGSTAAAESQAKLNFKVKVTETDNSVTTITVADGVITEPANGANLYSYTLNNFDLTSTGTRTATFAMYSFTLVFDYTVTDPASTKLFESEVTAGEITTYTIINAKQFTNIVLGDYTRSSKDVYKLGADIDFSTLDTTTFENYSNALYAEVNPFVFSATIDGGKYNGQNEYLNANYKILNYTARPAGEEMQGGLFYLLGDCTFKNIDLLNCKIYNTAGAGAGLFGMGYYSSTVGQGYTYNFNHINMSNCSIVGNKNSGLFVGYACDGVSVNIEYGNIDGTCSVVDGSDTAGGFVGSMNNHPKTVHGKYVFKHCTMSGILSAKSNCGAMIGNQSAIALAESVEISDCIYNGKMYIMSSAASSSFDKAFLGGGDATANVSITNSYDTAVVFTRTDNTYTGTRSINKIIGSLQAGNGTSFFTNDNHFTFTKFENATNYVVTVSYVVAGSSCAWTEELEQFDTTTTITEMKRILAGYTAPYANANSKSTDTLNGVMVAERYSERTFLSEVAEGKTPAATYGVTWSIAAYGSDGMPVASANGSYTGTSIIDGTKIVGFTVA